MRESVLNWLGFELVTLSAEADVKGDATRQCARLFDRFADALAQRGLDLSAAVRSRLFGRDRAARDAASATRVERLSGPARCATSSYIAPKRFSSDADVAMDLIAVRPHGALSKRIRENDPMRTPCRWLTFGPLIVFSGQTAVLPTLEMQVTTDILPRITSYLEEEQCGWKHVAEVNCYLHREEDPAFMRDLYLRFAPNLPPRFACHPVEGYSARGKRVEIEVTAQKDT